MSTKVTCQKCNSVNDVRSTTPYTYKCKNCKNISNVIDDRSIVFAKKQIKSDPRPYSHLKIGQKGRIYGKEITIIGHIQYVQRDDGANYYWEDWYAQDEEGAQYWIDYDTYSEQFTFFKRVEDVDLEEFNKLRRQSIPDYKGDKIEVVERGSARTINLSGEMPFIVSPGDRLYFIDGIGGKGLYSLEHDGQLARLYLGQNIDEANLYESFGLNQIAEKIKIKRKRAIRWRFVDIAVFLITVFSFVAIAFFHTVESNLYRGALEVCDETATFCTADAQIGPYQLQRGALYRLGVSTEIDRPSYLQEKWKSVVFEIQNEQGEPQNGEYYDLWSEYWIEDGESGVESNTVDQKVFRSESSGNYSMKFIVESSANINQRVHLINVELTRIYGMTQPMLVLLGFCTLYLLTRTFRYWRKYLS